MKFTISGIVVFVLLFVGYYLWSGKPPKVSPDSILSQHSTNRIWFYCAMLFVVGAGSACFGDKEYGMFPPASLRWLFIVAGSIMMIAAVLWMHSIRDSALGATSL